MSRACAGSGSVQSSTYRIFWRTHTSWLRVACRSLRRLWYFSIYAHSLRFGKQRVFFLLYIDHSEVNRHALSGSSDHRIMSYMSKACVDVSLRWAHLRRALTHASCVPLGFFSSYISDTALLTIRRIIGLFNGHGLIRGTTKRWFLLGSGSCGSNLELTNLLSSNLKSSTTTTTTIVLPPLLFSSLQPPCPPKQLALEPVSEPTAIARLHSRRKDVWRQADDRAHQTVVLQLCAPRRRLPSRDLGVIAGSSPMEPAAPMALEETCHILRLLRSHSNPIERPTGTHSIPRLSLICISLTPSFLPVDFFPTNN